MEWAMELESAMIYTTYLEISRYMELDIHLN